MTKKNHLLGSITALIFLIWIFGSRISTRYFEVPTPLVLSVFFVFSFVLLLQQRNQKATLTLAFLFFPLIYISALPISDFYTLRQAALFIVLSISAFSLGITGGGIFLKNKIMLLILVFSVLSVSLAIVGVISFNVTKIDGVRFLVYDANFFEIKQRVSLHKALPGVASLTDNPNAYGLVSSFFIFLPLLSYHRNQITKRLALWIITFGIIGLFLSFSRGSILGVLAGFIAALAYRWTLRHTWTRSSFVLHSAAVTLACSTFAMAITFFISASISHLDVDSFSGRVGRWRGAIESLDDRIIIGEGRGEMMKMVSESPHSGYLQALLELGLSGVLWLWFFTLLTVIAPLLVARTLTYSEKKYISCCVGLLFFVLVHSIFENGILATLPHWAIFCFASGAIWNQVLFNRSGAISRKMVVKSHIITHLPNGNPPEK